MNTKQPSRRTKIHFFFCVRLPLVVVYRNLLTVLSVYRISLYANELKAKYGRECRYFVSFILFNFMFVVVRRVFVECDQKYTCSVPLVESVCVALRSPASRCAAKTECLIVVGGFVYNRTRDST